ncbi:MAG TPA: AzlD domain-containing protein [Dehalococcoidia bacterium]
MREALFWTVLGMGAVTYLPRLLPLLAAERVTFPPYVLALLRNIPYAVLGALIFPGVLDVEPAPWAGLAGVGVAALLAWLRAPLLVVLFGAIAAALLAQGAA